MVTYAKFQASGKTRNRFVFFLSFCDFFFSAKFFVTACIANHVDQFSEVPTVVDINDFCFWFGAFGEFIALATTSWNMMISVHLFRSFRIKSKERTTHDAYYHLYVWGLSLVNSAVLIYLRAFGKTYNGCWIAARWLDMFFLVPLATYIISSTVIMIIMRHKINRARQNMLTVTTALIQKENNFRSQMMKYTLVFIVVWLFPLITRLLSTFGYESGYLIEFHIVCDAIQSLANSIVWATSPNFVKFIKEGMRKGNNERQSLIQGSQFSTNYNNL
eukprot:TRINITY_DN7174_c0_g1_i2.p1 TRINITY_DN7174_c0_g1~~TRINITY_DN7174_c0_g1_i2.p1  ORF type:complete len:307 (+),score=30.88 TRINITY_DN7174_c0_g1_i2:102-923(+)